MPVLSINSQVCFGHIGAQAVLLPLQRSGFEVWHVPTVLFSNHPGHGAFRGSALPAAQVATLVQGMAEGGFLDDCTAVHSGYLGEASTADVVHDALARVRARNGGVLYCCDPVLGDDGHIYVADGVLPAIRDRLLPLADILTPNRHELGWLSERTIERLDDAVAAARALQARGPGIVVATSAAVTASTITTIAVSDGEVHAVDTPHLERAPYGTGDMFTALFLARYLQEPDVAPALGHAASATHGVVAASIAAGSSELTLVAAQETLTAPAHRFKTYRIE